MNLKDELEACNIFFIFILFRPFPLIPYLNSCIDVLGDWLYKWYIEKGVYNELKLIILSSYVAKYFLFDSQSNVYF